MTAVTGYVVPDTSLAMKWVLDEAESDIALQLLREWERDGIEPVVPSWFACEVANVLFKFVLRGDLAISEAHAAHVTVMSLVLVWGDEPDDARRALELAAASGQRQTYDTQFLALAERLGCPLWTADDRFHAAVQYVAPMVRALREVSRG